MIKVEVSLNAVHYAARCVLKTKPELSISEKSDILIINPTSRTTTTQIFRHTFDNYCNFWGISCYFFSIVALNPAA